MKPTIAITMGDPVGIGPEITLKAVNNPKVKRLCRPIILGDKAVLECVAQKLKNDSPVISCPVINLSNLNPKRLTAGKPNKACGTAAMSYIKEAADMTIRGDVAAMVTAPINKHIINRAGYAFPGHTEYLANLTNTIDYAMMLGGKRLKVILVTIHEAIRQVPELLTSKKILKTIEIANTAFKEYFDIRRPRIAVSALNPHAGEGGLFGDEEKRIILPAIRKARRLNINVSDPLPPDTVFYRAVEGGEFDCVLCMYHDQGLIPLKLLHFKDGVNVTLGLPIIRTSVDHGTAYDIAWKGIAGHESMIAAIELASEMANKKCGKVLLKPKTPLRSRTKKST